MKTWNVLHRQPKIGLLKPVASISLLDQVESYDRVLPCLVQTVLVLIGMKEPSGWKKIFRNRLTVLMKKAIANTPTPLMKEKTKKWPLQSDH